MVKIVKHRQDSQDWRFDVTIIGAGPSGLSLACALGTAGHRAVCLEKAPAAQALHPRPDGRTLALSVRSARILRQTKVWPLMERDCCPIRHIHVADQESPRTLAFRQEDGGGGPFGWIVETQVFQNALLKRARQLTKAGLLEVVYDARIERIEHSIAQAFSAVELQDGRIFLAPLLVAADGRRSHTRDKAGIPVYGWGYRQSAVVCVVRHELPHDNIAVEHFQPGGPFAVLPMADDRARSKGSRGKFFHRSSIVWTETTEAARFLMQMEARRFVAQLQERVRDYLGDIELVGERFSYPLSLQHARRYVEGRLVLVGDAAHGIHPIAGQGFNLGMGDIGDLVDLVSEATSLGLDVAEADALQRYERGRIIDNEAMVVMTDGLVKLFSNAIPPAQALRRFGLGAVDRLPRVRRAFARHASGA
ncbi:MAG: UbiH/UbiF/VisC/COQ6 family ubiquinone biosynthesis hydroxylase [Bdellovibrionales bacterium]